MENCGGPSIPFRAGRIDAEVGGPETVPEPHQDLASHTASFALQGFDITEMIGALPHRPLKSPSHTAQALLHVDIPSAASIK
jgi:hypothetical protein